MESAEFRRIFGEVAKSHGFTPAFGGWFAKSNECVLVLGLQRSNFGPYFALLIKVYVQGMFGNQYEPSKALVKTEIGNISREEPPAFRRYFELDNGLGIEERVSGLEKLFTGYIVPWTPLLLSRSGLRALGAQEVVDLLPAVGKELTRLSHDS